MLEDVLRALGAVPVLEGVAIVTRDPDILTAAPGVRLIVERENRGQSAAVGLAARRLAAEGVDGMITVPADVPLVSAHEIERILEAHGVAPAMTIVPAQDGRGTNGIACSPPDLMPFRFGEDSFRGHLQAARKAGLAPRVVRARGLGLDIDLPADLHELNGRAADTRSHAYLERSGLARRLRAGAGPAGSVPAAAGER